ncbi:hypothetical protein [Halobiforma nitratireducens]|uniref:Uncharacterized protein n=1 Tax=Halobiforma nitratireducens JCM 10879 TaxID=1227454 RepID=M0LP97_9EURY|nr:hypothetical protein [Halobiforma nitratireducens]EMA35321.1 hypothetical protein C446_12694 [Halobiforma nitratireducens JCM 10879]
MMFDAFVAVLGVVGTAGLFAGTYWDANRVPVSRPLLWAAAVAGAFAVGVGLHLFATVPTTGIIMTANTGLVLYGFEREVTTEDDDASEPGRLPEQ